MIRGKWLVARECVATNAPGHSLAGDQERVPSGSELVSGNRQAGYKKAAAFAEFPVVLTVFAKRTPSKSSHLSRVHRPAPVLEGGAVTRSGPRGFSGTIAHSSRSSPSGRIHPGSRHGLALMDCYLTGRPRRSHGPNRFRDMCVLRGPVRFLTRGFHSRKVDCSGLCT